jgi:hypothetical protein
MKPILGAVSALFIFLGCAAVFTGKIDPWSRPLPKDMAGHLVQLNDRNIFQVASGAKEKAVAKLESVPFLALNLREAEALVGQTLDGGEYFLVRGLCLGCGNGSFRVYFDSKNIFVYNFSLAKRGTRPTRWPVVVSLEEPPEQVYVECGSAQ